VTRAAAAAAVLALAACRHPSKVGTAAPGEPERAKHGETAAQKGVPPEGDRPRVPSSPKALLAEGQVAKLQQALDARGYLGKERRAGTLDDPTTRALRRFQRAEGLAETGFPDRLTLQKLGLDPEDAYGKVRDEVKGGGGEKDGAGKGGEGSAGGKGEGR
jgi:peptidoglycan hydrolase-like protein with peptidoglycan-binding domain